MIRGATIGAMAGNRENNFNLLRMLAALGVVISHAYPISLGREALEPLERLLGGITLGTVCVYVFFSISGFFIARSFAQSPSWQRFLAARALRLFPALAVVLGVTILLAGGFLTSATPAEFWREAPSYFLRNITLVRLDNDLPGVFVNNPLDTSVNGSLWTLFYEVVCYAGILMAGLLKLFERPGLFSLALLYAMIACLALPYLRLHPQLDALATLALPFAIGTSYYVWRDRLPLSPLLALALASIAAAAHGTGAFRPLFVVALSYAVFLVGYWPSAALQHYNRLGDYSYGTYIYAFPVQQLFASLGVASPLLNMALSLPVTLVCAVASWHLVERPALKYKPVHKPHSASDLKTVNE